MRSSATKLIYPVCIALWGCEDTSTTGMLGDRSAPAKQSDGIIETLVAVDPSFSFMLPEHSNHLAASIETDLRALNASVADVVNRDATSNVKLIISDYGNAIAFTGLTQADSASVAVWPDWQESESVVRLNGWRHLTFLSPKHVIVTSSPRSVIVDLETGQDFELPRELGRVNVAANGRWAANGRSAAHEGASEIVAGRLEDSDSLKQPEFRLGTFESFLLLQSGTIIATQSSNNVIETRRFGEHDVVDITEGTFSVHGPACDVGFFGHADGHPAFIAVDEQGTMTSHRLAWLGGSFDERATMVSPLGRSAVTNADTLVPGGYERRHRVMPWAADEVDEVPLPRGCAVGWLLLPAPVDE